MQIERIDQLSFHVLFSPDEMIRLENDATKSNKKLTVFIAWLLFAGQQIFNLTTSKKET